MVSMRVVQMIADQVVDMVPVWNSLVAAAGPVFVVRLVFSTPVRRSTPVRICRSDRDNVLVNVIPVRMVQVSIMQVVDVAFV